MPYVSEVIYPRDLADLMSSNIHDFSLILLGVALALLLVSMVLIVNTIRLQIYAKRFLINTMTLVGATSWVTRRPFVWRNMLMGLFSGIAALAVLSGVVYFVENRLGVLLFPLTWQNVAFLCGAVVLAAFVITFFSAVFAVNRYIRMKTEELYYV